MKTVVSLTEKERDGLVLDILTDSIIFERVSEAMNLMQRAANPDSEDWEPIDNYNSFINAFPLMGFSFNIPYDEEKNVLPIRNVLWDIFHTTIKSQRLNDKNAKELAEIILEKWKEFLEALDNKSHKVA